MYSLFLGAVQFPVTPPKISMKINGRNKTIELMNEGEVNIIKKAGLTDIGFELLLPNSQYPFAIYPKGFKPAAYYLEVLEKLKQSEKPDQFIVNRMKPSGELLFDTNLTVSVEDYEINEDAEDGFDLRVTVKLKQFKLYGTKRLVIQNTSSASATAIKVATPANNRATTAKVTPKTHTVANGDTLWSVAKKHLGDGSKANIDKLAKLNNLKNPNLIKVGQVIKLG